jgi:hypothetical protein
MAVQTISTTSDIPKVLDPFYLGRPGKGTVGQPGYEKPYTGLIDRGFEAISLRALLAQKRMPEKVPAVN